MYTFLIIGLGYAVGNIKVFGLQLGASGILLVALVFGHNGILVPAAIKDLGQILFVGMLGFSAGPILLSNLRNKVFGYITTSVAVVVIGVAVATILGVLFHIPKELALGIYAGAMTSTPGLAAALEATGSDLASVGYGVTYPFGVVGVVLFVQFIPRLLKAEMPEEVLKISEKTTDVTTRKFTMAKWNAGLGRTPEELDLCCDIFVNGETGEQINKRALKVGDRITVTDERQMIEKCDLAIRGPRKPLTQDELMIFGLVMVLSLLLSKISIPLPGDMSFSFGSTGTPLIIGLLFGYFAKGVGPFSYRISEGFMDALRELGMVMFLAGAGTGAGVGFVDVLLRYGLVLFFIGAVVTIVPMVSGYILAKHVFKLELLNALGSVCGAMTSTPSLGALINASRTNNVVAAYAATYPIAMIFMVLSTQIMAHLLFP